MITASLIEWAPVVWGVFGSRTMIVCTFAVVMAVSVLLPAYMAFRDGPS